MKKLLAAILFFGSVSMVMAQITPGGWQLPLYGAGILNPDMPRQVCKFRKEMRPVSKNPKDYTCESPSGNSGPLFVPNGDPKLVSDMNTFKRDHSDWFVIDPSGLGNNGRDLTVGGVGCSTFARQAELGQLSVGTAQAACNGARFAASRDGSAFSGSKNVFASVTDAIGSFWATLTGGRVPVVPAAPAGFGSINARTETRNIIIGPQACFFAEKLEMKEVSVPYDCVTVAPSCEMTQMKIFSAEMMVKEMQLQIQHIQDMQTSDYFKQEMKDRMLRAAQARLSDAQKELLVAKSECDRKSCDFKDGSSDPMGGGLPDEEDKPTTCRRKQQDCCISPSPTGQCTPCRPYHSG